MNAGKWHVAGAQGFRIQFLLEVRRGACMGRREGGREGGVSIALLFLTHPPFEPLLPAQGTSNHRQEVFSPTLSGQHGREKISSGYRIFGGAHSNQESC